MLLNRELALKCKNHFQGDLMNNRHFGAEVQHNTTFDRSPADDLVLNCISLIVIVLFCYSFHATDDK